MIQRLRHRDEFTRLRREGTRVRSGAVWCVMVADSSLDGPRMAFAIGRTAGTAVQRNRARRRLREVIRHHATEMKSGLYLWGLTRPAAAVTFDDLSSAVPSILAKVDMAKVDIAKLDRS